MQEVELLKQKVIINKSNINNLDYYRVQYEEAKKATDLLKQKYDEFKEKCNDNMLECTDHIPVTLGQLSKTIVLGKDGNIYPVIYRKCILCGCDMSYNHDLDFEIDATNYEAELNDDYESLNKKYIHIIDKFKDHCNSRAFEDKDVVLNDFKIYIENNGFIRPKTKVRKAKK